MGKTMRGDDAICGELFSYIDLEKRVRADHPLRVIREVANTALKSLTGEFAKLYSPIGRPHLRRRPCSEHLIRRPELHTV
jgi:hypothetical protein